MNVCVWGEYAGGYWTGFDFIGDRDWFCGGCLKERGGGKNVAVMRKDRMEHGDGEGDGEGSRCRE